MKKQLTAMALALLLANSAYALEMAGVNLPEKVSVAETPLVLNGAGIRKKMVFDVYVAALYTAAKSNDANAIINAATPRRIQLDMLRNVESAALYNALLEGLQDNLSAAQLKALAPKVAELEKIFTEIKVANKGDVIVLDFLPGKGVKVLVRGQVAGMIAGDAIASAMLSIWLGKSPVSESLKAALLKA